MFENHKKSLIYNIASEASNLHFEWTKSLLKNCK